MIFFIEVPSIFRYCGHFLASTSFFPHLLSSFPSPSLVQFAFPLICILAPLFTLPSPLSSIHWELNHFNIPSAKSSQSIDRKIRRSKRDPFGSWTTLIRSTNRRQFEYWHFIRLCTILLAITKGIPRGRGNIEASTTRSFILFWHISWDQFCSGILRIKMCMKW